MKAKLLPKYAGIFPLVVNKYTNVPSPELTSAIPGSIPTKMGTNTVAPNIVNKCCKLNPNVLGLGDRGYLTPRHHYEILFSDMFLSSNLPLSKS